MIQGTSGVQPAKRSSYSQVQFRCTIERQVLTVPKSSAKPVISIGEGLFDLIADQKGKSMEAVETWTAYPGGAPCNVACGLAQLGVPSVFASALGKDKLGDQLMTVLQDKGVDTGCVERVEQPTRGVYVTRGMDGDRQFAGFGQPTGEYCDCFIEAREKLRKKIQQSSIVISGTLGLAYPTTAHSMRAALKIAQEADIPILIDVNWRPVFWEDPEAAKDVILPYMSQANIIKISDADLEYLYQIDPQAALKDPLQVADKLPDVQGVLITAGGDGCSYAFKDGSGKWLTGTLEAYDVNVTDTTGAGDMFTAGFVSYLLENGGMDGLTSSPEQLRAAVAFAAACGALTTEKPGAIAGQPTKQAAIELATK